MTSSASKRERRQGTSKLSACAAVKCINSMREKKLLKIRIRHLRRISDSLSLAYGMVIKRGSHLRFFFGVWNMF